MIRLASAMYSSQVLRTRRRPGIGGSQSGSCRRRTFAAMLLLLVLHVAQRDRPPAGALALALAQHVDHHVEGPCELPDLVVGAHRDVGLVVVAALQRVRGRGELLDRLDDRAREPEG